MGKINAPEGTQETNEQNDLQIEQLKALVDAQDEVIETLKDAVDSLQVKLGVIDENLKALNTKVDSAPSPDGKAVKRVLKDPGEVTIAGSKYKFTNLIFRLPTASGHETVIAEEAANDKKYLEFLLKEHPSTLQKV